LTVLELEPQMGAHDIALSTEYQESLSLKFRSACRCQAFLTF